MRKKTILVILPLALLMALLPLMAMAAGGPWSDNFDAYADGSQIHGQGGWIGWGDDPTFGAFVTDDQARSAPHSLEIAGAADPIQQFAVTDGQWVMTAWQYIPANMVGEPMFIMLNTYDHACATCNWSVQVNFNSTTGTMFDAGTSGASQPYLTDQWVEIRVEIDLDADTQDFYYNDALFYSSTWSGHVSGNGATSIANLDLFANNATAVYYDDFSLEEVVVGEPGLEIDKSPDTQDVVMNGNADFTITITNSGTLTWTDVTVTDAEAPACDNNFTDMAPGTVETYTCTDTGVTATYTNTAVAVGTITGGPTATDSDSAVVNVVPPTSVSLSGFGGDTMNIATGWIVAAAAGVGLAVGFFVLTQRRRQTH